MVGTWLIARNVLRLLDMKSVRGVKVPMVARCVLCLKAPKPKAQSISVPMIPEGAIVYPVAIKASGASIEERLAALEKQAAELPELRAHLLQLEHSIRTLNNMQESTRDRVRSTAEYVVDESAQADFRATSYGTMVLLLGLLLSAIGVLVSQLK